MPLTARQRFLASCRLQPVDRRPVWLMRQAGRYLPEYRELRRRHSFHEMVRQPELATEVTLQPIRRYGMDAAILFSDILVIPEALGQPYAFREGGGILMADTWPPTRGPVYPVSAVRDRLAYVADALRMIRRQLGGDTALLGFCGSPFTLATYMIEGGSAVGFPKFQEWRRRYPTQCLRLLETLSGACREYLHMQIEAGADAVQIFDSWGGLLGSTEYDEFSLNWIADLAADLPAHVPVILFARGQKAAEKADGAPWLRVLAIDESEPLVAVRRRLSMTTALQGNLAPALTTGEPEPMAAAVRALLEEMAPFPGLIVNLGHGIPPEARPETIAAFIETVQNSSAPI